MAEPQFHVGNTEDVPLSLLEEVAWNYDASSHSTRGHPLAPLRVLPVNPNFLPVCEL